MADSAIASLFIELGLDTTDLKDGIQKGTAAVNDFSKNILNVFKKTSDAKVTPDGEKTKKELSGIRQQFERTASSILRNFVAPLTAAFSVNRLFSNFVSQADEWGKFAQKTRVNGETLQLWARAAVNAGGSAEALKNSVAGLQAKINQSVDLGRRGFTMAGRIQLRTVNADGSRREAFDVLRSLADRATTMNATRFEYFASSLGIDKDTIQLLKLGGAELDKMIERQKQLGVYTKEDFELSRKFNAAMNDMKQALSMVAAIIARVLVRPLTWLTDTFTDIVVFLREHQHFVEAFFVGLGVAITASAIPAVAKLVLAMSPLLKTFALIAALAIIAEDFFVWLEGGDSAFSDWWEKLGTPEEVKKSWEDLKETFEKWRPILKAAAAGLLAIVAGLMLLSAGVGAVKTLGLFAWIASGAVGALGSAVKVLGTALIGGVAAAAKWGAGMLASMGPVGWVILALIAGLAAMAYWWDDIKKAAGKCADWVREKWDGLSGWWDNICDGISNKWHSVWDDIVSWFKEKIGVLESYVPDWLKNWVSSDDEGQTPGQKENKAINEARQRYENELVFSGMSPEEAGRQGEIYAERLRRERARKSVQAQEMISQINGAQTLAPAYAIGGAGVQAPQSSKTDIDQRITINVDTKDDPQAVAEGVAGVFRNGGTAERAARNLATGTLAK